MAVWQWLLVRTRKLNPVVELNRCAVGGMFAQPLDSFCELSFLVR